MTIAEKKKIGLLCGITLLCGCLFFFLYHNILIVRFIKKPQKTTEQKHYKKKKIQIILWGNNAWNTEETEILWNVQYKNTLEHTINKWLTIMEEEGYMNKRVLLQSLALSANQQEAYLSFDQYPFDPQASTLEKYNWIKALLKTIHMLNTPLKTIYFLVHHKPLEDYSLDFSLPWPIRNCEEKK